MTPRRPAHGDDQCGARWDGANTSHCSGCHYTFSTVANFDRHRKDGTCLDPAAVGLVVNGSGYWGQPPSEDADSRFRGRRQAGEVARSGIETCPDPQNGSQGRE